MFSVKPLADPFHPLRDEPPGAAVNARGYSRFSSLAHDEVAVPDDPEDVAGRLAIAVFGTSAMIGNSGSGNQAIVTDSGSVWNNSAGLSSFRAWHSGHAEV